MLTQFLLDGGEVFFLFDEGRKEEREREPWVKERMTERGGRGFEGIRVFSWGVRVRVKVFV